MLGADVPPEVENDLVVRLELDRLAQREEDGKPGEHAWNSHNFSFIFQFGAPKKSKDMPGECVAGRILIMISL